MDNKKLKIKVALSLKSLTSPDNVIQKNALANTTSDVIIKSIKNSRSISLTKGNTSLVIFNYYKIFKLI